MVRPWKEPSAVSTSGRPVRRLILKAASFASAPELQKNTWARSKNGVSPAMRSASSMDR